MTKEHVIAPSVPGQDDGTPSRRSRKGGLTLALALLMLVLIFVFEVIGYLVSLALPLDEDFCATVGGAIGGVVGVVVLGGWKSLVPTRKAMGQAWRTGWWVIAVSVGLFAFDIGSYVVEGEFTLAAGWLGRLGYLFALCLAIGVSEETMFRGLLLCGILDVSGRSRRGVITAAVVSSVLFGAAHVGWTELDYHNALDIVQAVLKTMQTGTYGFFLAALVVRSKNITGPIVLHALDDFILLVPSIAFFGESLETNYISSGDTAMAAIILYVVIILLYLPLVWRGIKLLLETPVPEYGVFHRD